MDFMQFVRDIPDFPQEGVLFRDITPVLQNAEALHAAVDRFCDILKKETFDYVLGPESRGFIFGVPVGTAAADHSAF